MAGAFGFQAMPNSPAPNASAVGQALLQRRLATNPVNAIPGTPNLVGNTMRGQLPQIGRRLLQGNPSQMPMSQGQDFGGMP